MCQCNNSKGTMCDKLHRYDIKLWHVQCKTARRLTSECAKYKSLCILKHRWFPPNMAELKGLKVNCKWLRNAEYKFILRSTTHQCITFQANSWNWWKVRTRVPFYIHTCHKAILRNVPDSEAHGANMGPTWVLSAPDGPILVHWTLPSVVEQTSGFRYNHLRDDLSHGSLKLFGSLHICGITDGSRQWGILVWKAIRDSKADASALLIVSL